jgi:hypothetical protein
VSALILSVRKGVGVEKTWTLLGSYDEKARTSFFGMALAIYIALETFGKHGNRYQVSMSILVLLSALYIAKKAWSARSIIGVATTLLSLIWIAPIINTSVFYRVDLFFMLTHSALSLLVAAGAFTYLKR